MWADFSCTTLEVGAESNNYYIRTRLIMVKYQITYTNKHQERSDRARMAIDLKLIYWKDRPRPKDWYWFEGNITIESVPGRDVDCVIIYCKHLAHPHVPGFIDELVKNKTVNSVCYDQGDDFYITIYAKFPW